MALKIAVHESKQISFPLQCLHLQYVYDEIHSVKLIATLFPIYLFTVLERKHCCRRTLTFILKVLIDFWSKLGSHPLENILEISKYIVLVNLCVLTLTL